MFRKNRIRHILAGPVGYILAFLLIVVFVVSIFNFISGTSSVEVLAQIRARGTVKIGVMEDMLPFCKVSVDGKAQGFEAELAQMLGEKVLGGSGVQFYPVNSKTALAYLLNDDCDILVSMVVVNSANRQNTNLSLSDPYVQEDVTMLSANGALVNLQSPETKVGVIRNSDAKSVLTAYISGNRFNATVLDIESFPDAIAALQNGTITAFCAPRSSLGKYALSGIAISPVIVGQLNYAFAVKKANVDLYNAFGDALEQLQKDGRLNDLYARYHLSAPMQ